MRRLIAYWFAILLHITGWGVYYSVSRSLVKRIGWNGLLLLVAAETLPSVLSVPASDYAARRGYARLLAFSVPEVLGLLLFGYLPWPYQAAAVLVAAIGWAVAGPQTLNAVLEDASGRGSRLGAVLTSGALGWSLGGLLGPIIYSASSLQASMVVAASLVALCYLLLYIALPPTAYSPGGSRVTSFETLAYSLALSPLVLAMEASFAAVMSALSVTLTPLEYGLVLAGTGVTSALGKLVVGVAADRIGVERFAPLVYRASFIAYSLWMLASSAASGWVLAILFLTPVYPLYEMGFYLHASRLLGERRASAAWPASYTIAGLGALLLSRLRLGYATILYMSSVFALASLALVALVEHWIIRRGAAHGTGVKP